MKATAPGLLAVLLLAGCGHHAPAPRHAMAPSAIDGPWRVARRGPHALDPYGTGPGAGVRHGPALLGAHRVVRAPTRRDQVRPLGLAVVVSARGRRDGRRLVLARPDVEHDDTTLATATSPRGDVAVLWLSSRGGGTIRLSVLAPGARAFTSRSLEAATDDVADGALAFGPNGALLVVTAATADVDDGYAVAARLRTPAGGLGPPQRLGRARGFPDFDAALRSDGSAVVAWVDGSPGVEADDDGRHRAAPAPVLAAQRRPGAARFSRTVTLDDGGPDDDSDANGSGGIQVAADPAGFEVLWAVSG